MFFIFISDHEAFIDVVHQIARAPIELCSDCGHIRGGKCGNHQPAAINRQIGNEHANITGFRISSKCRIVLIAHHGNKRDQNPGPGTQCIMRNVKPESCKQGMFFILRGKNSLCDIPTATRFGTGIPRRPPVHRDINKKCNKRHPRRIQIGQK